VVRHRVRRARPPVEAANPTAGGDTADAEGSDDGVLGLTVLDVGVRGRPPRITLALLWRLKTTVQLDPEIASELRRVCRRRKARLRTVVDEALRRGLAM
jgi:hypothetical protein